MPIGREGRWRAARAEHDEVVGALVAAIGMVARFSSDRWHEKFPDGRWSHAEMALHVIRSYELGATAIASGDPGMQMRVAPLVAWAARTIMLPIIIARKEFPVGARAPREVVPDAAEALALAPEAAVERLRRAAEAAWREIRAADERRPRPRVRHAVFGPLAPLPLMRLLSAHTRHHARSYGAPVLVREVMTSVRR